MTRRAAVVGYGSIGRRHARLLAQAGMSVSVVSAQTVEGFASAPSIDALGGPDPDYWVIAKPTREHAQALDQALARAQARTPSATILVEKPLFDAPRPAPPGDGASVFVGYNLRFLSVIAALRAAVADAPVLRARFFCCSYLPDWRPGRPYRETSSARRDAGGGVLRELSHELDLAAHLLGPWTRATALGGRLSSLDSETEDCVEILGATRGCPVVSVSLNWIERTPERRIDLVTDAARYRADLLTGALWRDGAVLRAPLSEPRDHTYEAMHAAALGGAGRERLCRYDEGAAIVRLIDALEKTMTADPTVPAAWAALPADAQ